ncbi:hypothetical protein A3B51_02290 [Candidatus Curtissbacteria bacterium RIFCSPLOWO2_01_FULL_41_18]|uniref:Uncharacterized protein n=2 Tax=Candidatus Curtissiibacteriota TaxID=1752717 RepID=A0A1F5FY45_9BACT|nr:MAG: hypothetical protein A2696_02085 [Candidatus Curtissbacteria bacterium RIFCSPHIGHO2_01_FULL_41_13]OGE04393.1 MAG: hypothetical protein A3B51_02290 [Candidatus Curtissbacteria bacterium RIFCSPLOWO2_01_FULL_41_18]
MLERILAEKIFRRRRQFALRATGAPFERWNNSQEDRPVFHVMVKAGDTRMINNISIKVESVSQANQMAKVVFSKTKEQTVLAKIDLQEIRYKNGIIEVGEFGEIACDSIDDDGRVNFYMCLSRKIDVHSREHQQVILASRPVNP